MEKPKGRVGGSQQSWGFRSCHQHIYEWTRVMQTSNVASHSIHTSFVARLDKNNVLWLGKKSLMLCAFAEDDKSKWKCRNSHHAKNHIEKSICVFLLFLLLSHALWSGTWLNFLFLKHTQKSPRILEAKWSLKQSQWRYSAIFTHTHRHGNCIGQRKRDLKM